MIHVSWYVSWYKNSIKYQVSWYIFGTVSVSVTIIHFRCISIINHWYMTVIHLRRTSKKTAAVNSSSTVSATVSPIQTMQPIATNCVVEGDIFDYGTIGLGLLSTDATSNAVDSLTGGNVSTTWVHWNWKCWQDTVEFGKFSSSSSQLYNRLHQW